MPVVKVPECVNHELRALIDAHLVIITTTSSTACPYISSLPDGMRNYWSGLIYILS